MKANVEGTIDRCVWCLNNPREQIIRDGPRDVRNRIWKQHHLKPHLVETFKLSRDQRFVEKLHDVVGL
jgi:hypothetical protein